MPDSPTAPAAVPNPNPAPGRPDRATDRMGVSYPRGAYKGKDAMPVEFPPYPGG